MVIMFKQILLMISALLIGFVHTNKNLIFVVDIWNEGLYSNTVEQPSDITIGTRKMITTDSLFANIYRKQYLLGKSLRNKYKDFLPREYVFDTTLAYSIDGSISIQAANARLMGLYGPDSGGKLNFNDKSIFEPPIKNLEYPSMDNHGLPNGLQMIPIRTHQQQNDKLFSADSSCNAVHYEIAAQRENGFGTYQANFKPLFKSLIDNGFKSEKNSKEKDITMDSASKACRIVLTLYQTQKSVTNDILLDQCRLLLNFDLFYQFKDSEVRNLYLHQSAKLIKTSIEQRLTNPPSHMQYLTLSTSMTFIAAFLSAFKPNSYKCFLHEFTRKYTPSMSITGELRPSDCTMPLQYDTLLTMELYRDEVNNSLSMKFLQNNEDINLLNNMDDKKNYEEFLRILTSISNVDFDAFCFVKGLYSEGTSMLLIVAAVVVSLVTILAFSFFIVLRLKDEKFRADNDLERALEMR